MDAPKHFDENSEMEEIEREIVQILSRKKSESDETKDMIQELEQMTIELSLAVEEKKLNDYFDKQYRIYLLEQLLVSPLFSKRISHIIDLVRDDKISVFTNDEIISNSVQNFDDFFVPEENSDFAITIDSRVFLDSIIETYKSDSSIINQFLQDFARQIVTINGVIYDDMDSFFMELSSSNRKTKIMSHHKPGKKMSTMMLLLLITCQSSHYLSYTYPFNAINRFREKTNKNYYAISRSEMNVTNIIVDHIDIRPQVGCVIDSSYRIVDTDNNVDIYYVDSQTFFNEKTKVCVIRYKVKRL